MKKIQDERVINEKRRINSNAFEICLLGLWGIILYRQFMLHQDPSEYRDIFLLVIGLSMYVVFNNIFKGIYSTYRKKITAKKMILISALVGTISFSVVQAFMNNYDLTKTKDIFKIIISNIVFFSVWILISFTMFKLSDKQANKDIE